MEIIHQKGERKYQKDLNITKIFRKFALRNDLLSFRPLIQHSVVSIDQCVEDVFDKDVAVSFLWKLTLVTVSQQLERKPLPGGASQGSEGLAVERKLARKKFGEELGFEQLGRDEGKIVLFHVSDFLIDYYSIYAKYQQVLGNFDGKETKNGG